jgi:ligand-binding sensor domain-containing protein/two-component sensor histidine kinase
MESPPPQKCSGLRQDFLTLLYLLGLAVTAWITAPAHALDDGASFSIKPAAFNSQLSQKSIRELFVDSRGFLWIRTQDGVHRYDGYKVQSFYPRDWGLGAPGHGSAHQIAEDSSGKIWLATLGEGLAYYDSQASIFKPLILTKGNELSPPPLDVATIFVDKTGIFWLGTMEGEIFRFSPSTHQLDKPLIFPQRLQANSAVTSIQSDSKENLWIAMSKGELVNCNALNRKCNKIQYLPQGARPAKISTILIDDLDRLWVGTQEAGMYRINVSEEYLDGQTYNAKHYHTNQTARVIYQGSNRKIWIGTDTGLNVLGIDDELRSFSSANSNLADNVVLGISEDSNGNIWIGTHFGLYVGTKSGFETIRLHNGMASNVINAFSEVDGGTISIGTYDGLHNLKSTKESVRTSNPSIPGYETLDDRIMSLYYKEPHLWIGYHIHGLEKVNVTNGETERFNSKTHPTIESESISAIAQVSDQLIGFTTFGGGFYTVSERSGKVRKYQNRSEDPDGLTSDKLFSLYKARDSKVYIGGIAGLNAYSHIDNEVSAIKAEDDESRFIETTQVLAIREDASGNLWLGSQNTGLILWRDGDRRNGLNVFTRIKTKPKLPSSTVYAIENDDAGALWLSTTNGLVRLNPESLSIKVFDISDGLQDNEFNFGASFKDSHGRLYFGGNRGFNRFHPEDIVDKTTPPPVRLTRINIAGKDLAADVGFIAPPAIDLTYRDYFVNFEFSALDFTDTASNRYKYKLENFDSDWVDIGTRNMATFTALPPGRYLFRAAGASASEKWNYDNIAVRVNVFPPPWLSWWSFALYCAALYSLGLFIKKYYDTHILKDRASELATQMHATAEQAMDQLQEELVQEQNLVANVHAHTINTLRIITKLLDQQACSIQDETILEAFRDNQQRLRCLVMLQDNLIYSASGLDINLHRFIETLLTSLLKNTRTQSFEIIPINDTLNNQMPASVGIPVALIINELINNSVRHAFDPPLGVHGVKVSLTENQSQSGWLLEVSDSGVGLPGNIDPSAPTTMGMEIVKGLCQQLHATVTVERIAGTRFCFEIPRQG